MAALRKLGLLLGMTLGLMLVSLLSIRADTGPFEVLHSFNLAEGNTPVGALLQGVDGNLYGATYGGGQYGRGTVIQITPTGTVTILYAFKGKQDGAHPQAGLIVGADSAFYGTTAGDGLYSDGTIFRITATGEYTVLYAFPGDTGKDGSPDGGSPRASLVLGTDGNLYGTTTIGGINGKGTVFKLTPAGKETVLHSFSGKPDGAWPVAGLFQADDGNFYGTTRDGGVNGKGTIFKITPAGALTVLHSFDGNGDGAYPKAGLFEGWDNNLYGTTYQGGAYNLGTVFRISLDGAETILHSFGDIHQDVSNGDGALPQAGLTQGTDGAFYGTTTAGGDLGKGTIFRITADGALTNLYALGGNADGAAPTGNLMTGTNGCLYGTATAGGASGNGTVFYLDLALPVIASDINADLQTELIFQNKTTGQLALWTMQKYNHNYFDNGSAVYPTPSPGWNAVTTTVLKDQLNPTLLLHNPSTGDMAFWYLNGNYAVGGKWVYPTQDKNWKPVDMADFNGDGHPDILFQNPTTGQLALWYMNGNYHAGGAFVYPTQDPAWKAVGVTDLNGDGTPDILFQNPKTGQMVVWFMDPQNRNYATDGQYVQPAIDPAWQAVMVGDFDRDGKPDILFQNPATGQLCFWIMDGYKAIGGSYVYPTQDPNWSILGSR